MKTINHIPENTYDINSGAFWPAKNPPHANFDFFPYISLQTLCLQEPEPDRPGKVIFAKK